MSKVDYQFNVDDLTNLKIDGINDLKVRRTAIDKILKHTWLKCKPLDTNTIFSAVE